MKKVLLKKSRSIKWHDFVFTEQPQQRFRRHILFWLAWWLYFAGSLFYTLQGLHAAGSVQWIWLVFIKSLILLPCHIFLVYIVIYFLLPRYLLKARYVLFLIGLLIASVIAITWSYCCYALFFPLLDAVFHLPTAIAPEILLWNSITAGSLSALKVVMATISIKLLKRWWLKQQEKERLEKEKIEAELQLLKAQMQPDFLFSTLDHIHTFAQTDASRASELLLKLSEMLSYMLYECDQPMVPLEKELKMIIEYITMQQIRMGTNLETDISITGDAPGKMIAPLLLFPFIENAFYYCDNENLEKSWINLDMQITKSDLTLRLVNGISPDLILPDNENTNGLANVQRRLEIIYPDGYELKTSISAEIMMTLLRIDWNGTVLDKTQLSMASKYSEPD